jgi:uncharacterized damage-inducible protein DinB
MHNAAMKQLIAAAILIACSVTLSAQPPADGGYTSALRNSWNRVKRLVAASAESMPESNYAFKPTDDVRTFGQLLGHLANEHYMLCSAVKGEGNPQTAIDFEKKTTKADLVKALQDSNAYCDAVYSGLKDEARLTQPAAPNRRDTPFGTLLMNVTHDSEHYGNIVTYLRMKGIVPPSSQPTR